MRSNFEASLTKRLPYQPEDKINPFDKVKERTHTYPSSGNVLTEGSE
jgi:hypothetical protein